MLQIFSNAVGSYLCNCYCHCHRREWQFCWIL